MNKKFNIHEIIKRFHMALGEYDDEEREISFNLGEIYEICLELLEIFDEIISYSDSPKTIEIKEKIRKNLVKIEIELYYHLKDHLLYLKKPLKNILKKGDPS